MPKIYSSGTTLISNGLAVVDNTLQKWRESLIARGEDPDIITKERADFGTIMHVLCGKIAINEPIPIHILTEYVLTLQGLKMDKERIEYIMGKYGNEMRKDLLSFAQWMVDYNVKPLAIELMLKSDVYGVATPIDFICEMDEVYEGFSDSDFYKSGDKKGQPKSTKLRRRINAIIDFKSGQKNFYESHQMQLALNLLIFTENYPDIPIHKLYNWSPKDWKSSPTYNFKDQTDVDWEKAKLVFAQGLINHKRKPKRIEVFSGELRLKDGFEFNKLYSHQSIDDYILGLNPEYLEELTS